MSSSQTAAGTRVIIRFPYPQTAHQMIVVAVKWGGAWRVYAHVDMGNSLVCAAIVAGGKHPFAKVYRLESHHRHGRAPTSLKAGPDNWAGLNPLHQLRNRFNEVSKGGWEVI